MKHGCLHHQKVAGLFQTPSFDSTRERDQGSWESQAHPVSGECTPVCDQQPFPADFGQPGRTGMRLLPGAGWQTDRDAQPGVHGGALRNRGGQSEAEGLCRPEITGPMYKS